ncbi:hypothetical protein [Streptomyces sp. NPDC057460]|uniref:hypothetical protein n=1 Tax=Streptomyces sp. NPDC057460 TaxID=3346141 RepID=UPI0036995CEF
MGIVVTAAAALTVGYLLGRPCPWQRLGNWTADQFRFGGRGPRRTGRQNIVVQAHAVTAPRTSWRIMPRPATETRAPAPVRDPDWGVGRRR